MNTGMIILVIFIFALMGAMYFHIDWAARRDKDKKIESECLNRDYFNVPGLGKCMRCGNEAYLTTTVELPSVETKNGKLKYNKYDTKLLYSVHCRSCSLGTAQCEDISAVLREWNESEYTRIRDKAGSIG